MSWFAIQTLQEICVRKLALIYPIHENEFYQLPESMRGKLLNMLLRGRDVATKVVSSLMTLTLRKIDLSSVTLNNEIFHKLSKCTNLTFLNLNGDRNIRNDITDEGLIFTISGCSNLKNVQLRNCVLLTDISIVYLSKCCLKLERLNLYSCRKISDKALLSLSDNSLDLIGLNLVKTQITDVGIKHLSEAPCSKTLKEIRIDGCKGVTNTSIELLSSNCPKLSLFTFANCTGTSASWTSTCKFSADVMFFTIQ